MPVAQLSKQCAALSSREHLYNSVKRGQNDLEYTDHTVALCFLFFSAFGCIAAELQKRPRVC